MTSMLMLGVLLLFAWPQQSPNASVSVQKTATAYFYMISGVLGGAEITVDGRAVCRLQVAKYSRLVIDSEVWLQLKLQAVEKFSQCGLQAFEQFNEF